MIMSISKVEESYIQKINDKIEILNPENLLLFNNTSIRYGDVLYPGVTHTSKIAAFLLFENILSINNDGNIQVHSYCLSPLPMKGVWLNIPVGFLRTLLNIYLCDRRWGITKWICCRKNSQPHYEIVSDMKAYGSWDEFMEALPKNRE